MMLLILLVLFVITIALVMFVFAIAETGARADEIGDELAEKWMRDLETKGVRK